MDVIIPLGCFLRRRVARDIYGRNIRVLVLLAGSVVCDNAYIHQLA